MAIKIADQAVVDPQAHLEDDVEVGPFCYVGPHVRIGKGTRLANRVTVLGHTTIGKENRIHTGAVIGDEPQDLSYKGTATQVIIGDHNVIREGVTINRGTEKEEGVTRIGSHCYLMAGCHVAHDCVLGNRVVIANNTMLGGHVRIGDHATLSGGIAIHHFVSVGGYTFISGLSRVIHDVPPYMLADGSPTRARCVNIVALKRNEFDPQVIKALNEAYRLIYRAKVGLDAAREILGNNNHLLPEVNHLLAFLATQQGGRHGRGRDGRKAA